MVTLVGFKDEELYNVDNSDKSIQTVTIASKQSK